MPQKRGKRKGALALHVSPVVEPCMILETFPTAEEFYKTYWGKKPFIVREYIPAALIDDMIDGDSLAGLALEEDIKSRIITNNDAGNEWSCEHGPFEDDRFDDIGDKNWSLLVQNVEQYHTETAALLKYFQISPRWLLDDIMISFSAPGGSVGPHTDSYHTFLVQGTGKRTWKISADKINDQRFADNPHVKVLKHGFEGETFEVNVGDVIYMPPFFGHEGKTIDAAMTFSVGFLGPKLSEMLGDYAQYLEENEDLNPRYLAESLGRQSTGFSLGQGAQDVIKGNVIAAIESDHFACWMASYFSKPTHEEIDPIEEDDLTESELLAQLKEGETLFRPEHIKLTITISKDGSFNLAVYGDTISIPKAQAKIIETLNAGNDLAYDDIAGLNDKDHAITLVTALYNRNVLVFNEDN